jgi:hypothetical protein
MTFQEPAPTGLSMADYQLINTNTRGGNYPYFVTFTNKYSVETQVSGFVIVEGVSLSTGPTLSTSSDN